MNDSQFLQAVLPAAKGDLGVSFRYPTSLTRFLASAVGAKATLSEIFGLEHEDGTYNDTSELRFDLAKCEAAPENEIQKKNRGSPFLIRSILK